MSKSIERKNAKLYTYKQQGKLTKNTPLFTVENFKSNPMMKKSAKHTKSKSSNVFKSIPDMSRLLS
jgi:hypothetical protein